MRQPIAHFRGKRLGKDNDKLYSTVEDLWNWSLKRKVTEEDNDTSDKLVIKKESESLINA